jgi:hypothetical protein
MIRVYWCEPAEQGGFPLQRAAVGDCDLSVLRVGDEYHWLVRPDGRDVAEGRAGTVDEARRQAEAAAQALGQAD